MDFYVDYDQRLNIVYCLSSEVYRQPGLANTDIGDSPEVQTLMLSALQSQDACRKMFRSTVNHRNARSPVDTLGENGIDSILMDVLRLN